MAKDPAVLFYTSDFLTGTMMMSDDQTGKYIKLLCIQHQKGFLTEKDMMKICIVRDEDIFEKFEKIGENFLNKRMQSEAEKRKNYSLSRSNNRKKKNEDINNISNSSVKDMDNENINENINKDLKKKKKGKSHLFSESPFFDIALFEKQFENTDYQYCDLRIYYEKVKNWSEAAANKKVNWIATAKNFMIGDKEKNKLVLKNGVTGKQTGKSQTDIGEEVDELIKEKYGNGASAG